MISTQVTLRLTQALQFPRLVLPVDSIFTVRSEKEGSDEYIVIDPGTTGLIKETRLHLANSVFEILATQESDGRFKCMGELEVDLVRGVIYFHSATSGISLLRICGFPVDRLRPSMFGLTDITLREEKPAAISCD